MNAKAEKQKNEKLDNCNLVDILTCFVRVKPYRGVSEWRPIIKLSGKLTKPRVDFLLTEIYLEKLWPNLCRVNFIELVIWPSTTSNYSFSQ